MEKEKEVAQVEKLKIRLGTALIGTLNQWESLLIDDILAEEGAIKQYEKHLAFFNDLISLQEKSHLDFTRTLSLLGVGAGQLADTLDRLNKLINAVGPNVLSVQHIINEEYEHKREFEEIIAIISHLKENIRAYIPK